MKLEALLKDALAEAEHLLSPSATGRNALARRYVSHGEPAVEVCDGVLAVWTGPIDTKQVGTANAGVTQRSATVCVDVWRCWPTGDTQPPTVKALEAATLGLADDVDRLTLGLSTWLSCQCESVSWRPATPLGPMGGMAGWRLQIAVGL